MRISLYHWITWQYKLQIDQLFDYIHPDWGKCLEMQSFLAERSLEILHWLKQVQYRENSTSPFDWLLCAVWSMSDWLQITGWMIAEWMMVRSNQSDHSNRSMRSTFSHTMTWTIYTKSESAFITKSENELNRQGFKGSRAHEAIRGYP